MASNENVKIRVKISTHFSVNANFERVVSGPPRAEWDEMTEDERNAYLTEAEEMMLAEQVECWAQVVED